MPRVGNFSVAILGKFGYSKQIGEYVKLPHESTYSVELTNNGNVRCDAIVSIDGQQVGCWRIDSGRSIQIDRPANIARKFTFVRENSNEAQMNDVITGKSENGLITVIFKPEREPEYVPLSTGIFGKFAEFVKNDEPTFNYSDNSYRTSGPKHMAKRGGGPAKGSAKLGFNFFGSSMTDEIHTQSSGATILGEQSKQKFSEVGQIRQYDIPTTIHVRLIVNDFIDSNQNKYISLRSGIHNQIPPRID